MQHGLLNIQELQRSFRGRRIGRRLTYQPVTASTNDDAWNMLEMGDAAEGTHDGCVALAEYQTSGRGRLGRGWHAPRGASLLMSIGLLDEAVSAGPELGLLAAVCVWDAVAQAAGLRPVIKWPNDVLVGERKLAGVLVESRTLRCGRRAHVIGMGINCLQHAGHFPVELAGRATSLELECSHPVDRTALAVALLGQLDGWLSPPRAWLEADLRGAWLARSDMLGRRVELISQGRRYSGTIVDLDPVASLAVRLDDGGLRCFTAADTSLVASPACRPICA